MPVEYRNTVLLLNKCKAEAFIKNKWLWETKTLIFRRWIIWWQRSIQLPSLHRGQWSGDHRLLGGRSCAGCPATAARRPGPEPRDRQSWDRPPLPSLPGPGLATDTERSYPVCNRGGCDLDTRTSAALRQVCSPTGACNRSFANLPTLYSAIRSLKIAISQVETYARRQQNN